MIIGIDASPLTRTQYTGTEWYCYNIISALTRVTESEKHSWVLYVPSKSLTQTITFPKNWKIEILRWPLPFGWIRGRMTLRMFFHPPDVLFVPANMLPLKVPRNTVTALHDIGFTRNPIWYEKKERNNLIHSFKRAIRKARTIITISEFSKKEILNFFPQKDVRVTLLDRKRTQVPSRSLPKFIKTPYVVYLGRISPKKNIATLVAAWEALKKDTHFTSYSCYVVGRADPGSADLIKLIHSHIKEGIYYLPWIEECFINSLIRRAEVFVFPTWYEGFGMPLLEAQSNETPILCSDIPPNHETAGKGAQYFNPESPTDLTKKLRTLLSDKVLRKTLTQRGSENIIKFSWKRTAEETFTILTSFR